MRLNADFSRPVTVRPDAHEWVASPMPDVTRMMLDRVGDEVARATSFVRYSPNSTFPPHVHGGGEEILVLEGEFADEHGRYPAGSYLRNPVGTRHSPRVGAAGAEIFVKLHQFDPRDQRLLAIDTSEPAWLPGAVDGVSVMPLHRFGAERVALWRWAPDVSLAPRPLPSGAELLVLEGAFECADGGLAGGVSGRFGAGAWLRLPAESIFGSVTAGPEGALVYAKTGHLPPSLEVPPAGAP